METCFSRCKCSQSKDLKHLPGSAGAEMRRQWMGRKRFLSEAGPAPQWQWRLLPVSSSSYQGTSCRCCHGDALFLCARARGMERERGLISQPLLPIVIIVHYKKNAQNSALRTWCARSPDKSARSFNPYNNSACACSVMANSL